MESSNDHSSREAVYEKGVISLPGAVALGSGVMIGAGVLAVTGQIAELSGALFPLAFVAAAVVSGFSAYSYIKLAGAYPSAGDEVCADCGYSACTEIVAAQRLYPEAVRSMAGYL